MTITKIRKMVTVVDEIHYEMGRQINPPTRRAAAIAVVQFTEAAVKFSEII